MTLTITHQKVATLPDQPGVEVNKFEWNQSHSLTGTIDQSQNNVAVDGVTITGDGTPGSPLTAVTGGSGDVTGPASATDNAIVRYDGTTGKLIQNSAATIADTSGNITAGTYNGNTIGSGSTSGTNTGDQTITLTGDVTGSGTGSFATTIGATKVTSAMLNADVYSTAHSWGGTQTFTAPNIGAATGTSITVTGVIRGGAGLGNDTLPDGAGSLFTPSWGVGTTSGVAGFEVNVHDGTNNRRAGIFVDNTNGVVGFSYTYSVNFPTFVIRGPSNNMLSIDSSGNMVTLANITAGGNIVSTGSITLGAANTLLWSTSTRVTAFANGGILLNTSASAAGLGVKSTTTSSGVYLKFNSTAFNLRLGDDSADAAFTAAGATLSGTLAMGSNSITSTGSIGTTGSRLTKGWFTDLEVTNAIAGSVTGNAATVTTNANLTGAVTSSGNATTLVGGWGFSAGDTNAVGSTVYTIIAAFSGTINSLLLVRTTSGTITLAVKINGTNVTGLSAVAVTSTPATTNATAANTFVSGDVITIVPSSASSDLGLAYTLKATRT